MVSHYRSGEAACPGCKRALAWDEIQTSELVRCQACRVRFIFYAYPALLKEQALARPGEKIGEEGEASCFYHADKKAEVACDECGRFICGLCDLEMEQRHLCPVCFESGLKSNKTVKLERRRVLQDSIALWTALLPILIWPITIITGPTAIFLGIRSWRTPTSILGRTKVRQVLAILIGLLQTSAWGVVLVKAFNL